jgi:hypothetical protein
LRPHLSAAVPASVPPTSRIISVTVPSAPASARSTVKLFWMSMMMKARMLKSKESTTQPRNTAQNARHWSRETWRYQGRAADESSTTPGTADAAGVLTSRDSSCASEVCRTAVHRGVRVARLRREITRKRGSVESRYSASCPPLETT